MIQNVAIIMALDKNLIFTFVDRSSKGGENPEAEFEAANNLHETLLGIIEDFEDTSKPRKNITNFNWVSHIETLVNKILDEKFCDENGTYVICNMDNCTKDDCPLKARCVSLKTRFFEEASGRTQDFERTKL